MKTYSQCSKMMRIRSICWLSTYQQRWRTRMLPSEYNIWRKQKGDTWKCSKRHSKWKNNTLEKIMSFRGISRETSTWTEMPSLKKNGFKPHSAISGKTTSHLQQQDLFVLKRFFKISDPLRALFMLRPIGTTLLTKSRQPSTHHAEGLLPDTLSGSLEVLEFWSYFKLCYKFKTMSNDVVKVKARK